MSLKYIYSVVIVAMFATMYSCEPDLKAYPDFTAQLVVDGTIEEGERAIVALSQLIPSDSELDSALLSQIAIRWGKVTISCDGEEEVLVGSRDTIYLLQFYYRSLHMKGEAGKTYHITAEYDDVVATSSTTIPSKVDVLDLRAENVAGSDTNYVIMVKIDDPVESGDYYLISTKIDSVDNIFRPTLMGVWSDSRINLMDNEVPVYRALSINQSGKDFGVFYTSGDKVEVKISHIDEATYNYYLSQQELFINNSNPIYPVTENANTNVNGALGCWAGLGSVTYTIEIP